MFYSSDQPHGQTQSIQRPRYSAPNRLDFQYGLMQPIGRLGYMDYCRITDIFAMERPVWAS